MFIPLFIDLKVKSRAFVRLTIVPRIMVLKNDPSSLLFLEGILVNFKNLGLCQLDETIARLYDVTTIVVLIVLCH